MYKNKKGQVWVETVTYTLIAFVLIGLILAYARPKIQEYQDQSIIEQSMNMMKQIENTIQEISEKGIGNKRKIEFSLKGGEFIIIPENNTISFYLKDSQHMYSQPDYSYMESGMEVLTNRSGNKFDISIKKEFSNINLTLNDKKLQKTIPKSNVRYTMYIENKGGDPKIINFEVE